MGCFARSDQSHLTCRADHSRGRRGRASVWLRRRTRRTRWRTGTPLGTLPTRVERGFSLPEHLQSEPLLSSLEPERAFCVFNAPSAIRPIVSTISLGETAMKMIALTLSVIGLTAVAMSGCDNALNQPMPGQTPTAAAAPGQNAAGAPLVPANNPPAPGPATPRWNH